jgi:hypothetical protein
LYELHSEILLYSVAYDFESIGQDSSVFWNSGIPVFVIKYHRKPKSKTAACRISLIIYDWLLAGHIASPNGCSLKHYLGS